MHIHTYTYGYSSTAHTVQRARAEVVRSGRLRTAVRHVGVPCIVKLHEARPGRASAATAGPRPGGRPRRMRRRALRLLQVPRACNLSDQ